MSFVRQIQLLGVLIFTLLFVGVVFIIGANLKHWVEFDSSQRALDTASALALAVAPALAAGDRGLAISQIDGVFDGNAYEELRVSGPSLSSEIVREGEGTTQGVPGWFADVVALKPASAKVRIAGDNGGDHTVVLRLSSSDLYQRLWTTLLALLGLFVVGIILYLLLQSVYVRRFLQPLTLLAEQLRRIYRQQFTPSHIVNRYKELVPVVSAAEEAITSTRDEFQQLRDRVADTESKLTVDTLTGLGNKKALESELGAKGQDGPASSNNALLSEKGTIIVVELDDLREINSKHGVETTDKMLSDVAELIREQVNTIKFGRVWRTGGGTFMCRTDLTSVNDVTKWCDALMNRINDYAGQTTWVRPNLVAIGAVIYRAGDALKHILSLAEDALQMARRKTDSRFVVQDMPNLSEAKIRLSANREKILKDRLATNTLDLMYRPVLGIDGQKKVFHEITPWLPGDDGSTLSASELNFHAQRAGLDHELLSSSLAIAGDVSLLNADLSLSLKVGAPPKHDAEIEHWLSVFRDNLKIADGFGLQVSETPFSNAMIEALALLRESLNVEGMRFGIGSVGKGGGGHAWLEAVKPNYIVVDEQFGKELTATYGSIFYVTSLTEICKKLGIELYVDGVSDRQAWEQLKETGVNGVLGPYAGRMRPSIPD